MGKLNIAHHKSYHPYRRDNIERVRRDEEDARLQDAAEEGRMMLADSEARIDLLRQRAGLANQHKKRKPQDEEEGGEVEKTEAGPSSITSGGHINLFEDIERQMIPVYGRSTNKAAPETEKGIPLAPSEKDLKPWYSDRHDGKGKDRDEARETRELARKSVNDPLTSINHKLSARSSGTPTNPSSRSRPSHPDRPPPTSSSEPRSAEAARLNRESAERQRALELIRRKKREMAGSETPSTVHGGAGEGYRDVFNRREVEEARRFRERRWDERDRRDRRDDYRARW